LQPAAGGRFGFKVIDSKKVYNNYSCTACHAPKTGSSPQDLLNKLNTSIADVGNPDMNQFSTMSDEERRAIVYYLYYTPQ
jgi:mono/diheme cytochrome c family protein